MSNMTQAEKITVRVSFTLDIDPEAWETEYAVEGGIAAIRRDVKEHAEQSVVAHLDALGLLA